jgi:restriction system protein
MANSRNDSYRVLQREWDAYSRKINDCEKFINEIFYDGYNTNCNLNADEINKNLGWALTKSENIILDNVFILPMNIDFPNIDDLIKPLAIPNFPDIKNHPQIKLNISLYPEWYMEFIKRDVENREAIIKRSENIITKLNQVKESFKLLHDNLVEKNIELKKNIENCDLGANEEVVLIANKIIKPPSFLDLDFKFNIDQENKIGVIDFEFPNYINQQIIVDYKRVKFDLKPKFATETLKKKLVKSCLYSMIIRAAYIASIYRLGNNYESVVVNVSNKWHDLATGQLRNGIIASLQAPVEIVKNINLRHINPEITFKSLKGIMTPSLQSLSPIRPIFVMNKTDERFVDSIDIDNTLDEGTNLAAMEWEDFEHLVAQLFEWEFSKNGIEVKVTRASRDRGVDAILFDPNPLTGGKYVLQAKRYTRTVDVSSVRDLYGTVMNEGANKGILITTAGFGADSYEFVKDKPISLVDGQNLLLMLQKHGKKYKIDMEEARIRLSE